MPPIQTTIHKSAWFHHVSKTVAVLASTGAAVVSILTALFSYGVLGSSESHQSIGNFGAAWVRLRPAMDTASAIGDTTYFAATVADKNGSILVGARPTWTTVDSSIAIVGSDGAVVARGPGVTVVNAIVGSLIATSRIVVRQEVAGVAVANPAGDTAVGIPEGTELQLNARAVDSRGHTVAGKTAQWHIDDTTVAAVDSRGVLTANNAGRTVVTAKIDGASGYLPVQIVTKATALTIVAGAGQHALAGHALAQRVVVRATNRKGGPAAGRAVTFRVEGHGQVDPPAATTDADGRARANWTLGGDPGRQSLLASVENLDTTLTVEAEADPVAANTKVTALAEELRARAGTLLSDSIGVRVADSTGRVLPDVPVRWTALDGSVESGSGRTDSLGIARVKWTLSGKTGTQRLRALVGTALSPISAVTINATSLAGAAENIGVVSGDRQSAAAGATLQKSLTFRVTDANGNGAADVPVVLSPSGGTVPDTEIVTDSTGVARTSWTMGRSAGDYTLGVHVEGIKTLLKVTARSVPGPAANLSFDDAPPTDKRAGARPRVKRLLALVTDVYGNPVSNAPVNLSVKSGTITPARAVTDAKGRVAVTWTMGATADEQTLRGTVRGTDVKGAYITQAGTPASGTKTTPKKQR